MSKSYYDCYVYFPQNTSYDEVERWIASHISEKVLIWHYTWVHSCPGCAVAIRWNIL